MEEKNYKELYENLQKDYSTLERRLEKIIKQSDNQYRELLQLNERLEIASNTDPMTGAYNRRYFYNISKHMTLLARRGKYNVSLAMFDIDKFKNINDTYGHDVGDEVIKDLVNQITLHTRQTDIFARFGGEEFVLLLNNIDEETSKEFCDKLRTIIETSTNISDVNYTASIGVATVELDSEDSIEDALKKADLALYNAKESGRNKVVVYSGNN